LRGDDHVPVFLKPDQVAPVWLWMTTHPGGISLMGSPGTLDAGLDKQVQPSEKKTVRRRTRQVQNPNQRQAFVLPSKVESILTWSEFVSADRGTDDEEDDFDSATVANDMDKLSVVRSEETVASKVRFDLDLPGASQDDLPISAEFTLPEWDWRQKKMLPNHCGLRYFEARLAEAFVPSESLKKTVRKLRRRLETLSAAPRWVHRCHDGDAIDTDAWVRYQSERCIGAPVDESPAVYIRRQNIERSLATLLLADLSLSTDAYATSEARVIDVIREALYVFGEALSTTGDPFEVLGFSSIKRHQVRLQHLKNFDEPWNEKAKARVGAIKPGYYTRMGAAIRAATINLSQRGEQQRLLIILTDGKPNDLDIYEGRYGLEDTRQAIREAREQGLLPFCITIDEKAHDYMPYLFGKQGYALIHRPQELATRLTQVWASLVH
jgi:nitric oxide reductase NorD protein